MSDQPNQDNLGALLGRFLNDLGPLKDQIDRNAKVAAQSALGKLDVVTREEFDAQCALLERTRARLTALEEEFERVNAALEALQKTSP
jgi:hypothetical protein